MTGALRYMRRRLPNPPPAWMAGQPLFKIFEIPNTVHAGSAAAPGDDPMDEFCGSNRRLRAFSGMALRFDNSEIFLPALGGHQDYSGNEVTSIVLDDDVPAWQLRKAASSVGDRTQDSAYYADGTPSSRHLYWSAHWSTTHSRVMLHRSRFVYGSAVSFDDSNGFDPATNEWDPDNTWNDGRSASCRDASDNCWAAGDTALGKWTAATDTWETTATFATPVYNPLCHNSDDDYLFSLAWGDGQANGTGVTAWRITNGGTQREAISFNASAAYTQFQSDQPFYAAMEYVPDLRAFVFYDGQAGRTDRFYVVTPNAGTTWDMEILSLDAGSVTPPAASAGGIMNKMRYVPNLKGLVLLPSGIHNILFMRVA